MPIPLIWLSASAIAVLASVKYSNDQKLRKVVGCMPGDTATKVLPEDGSVVTCGVYGVFEHTGIWVDGNILELKGNGLIRAVSPKRFLQDRSGDNIYIACNQSNQPLIQKGTAERAISQVFSFSKYDVVENNCHKFVWQCISNENIPLTRFSGLNLKIAEFFGTTIHWQPIIY